MTPEYSPSELEELRLKRDIDAIVKRDIDAIVKRDIDAIVKRDCAREAEFDNTKPITARKTKRKKATPKIPLDEAQDVA